jgi:hypothetical protein
VLRSEVNVVVNGWQVAGTLATFCAVIVALFVATMNTRNQRRDEKRRQAERESKALAQARLVVMGALQPNPGVQKDPNSTARHMSLTAVNHSDRAIVDVIFVVRSHKPEENGFKEEFLFSLLVMKAGETHEFSWRDHYLSNDKVWWRMEWTDADGLHWYRDNRSGVDPVKSERRFESAYTAGEIELTTGLEQADSPADCPTS